MVTRRAFLELSATGAGLLMAGNASAFPAIAYAEEPLPLSSVDFKDTGSVNSILEVQAQINPPSTPVDEWSTNVGNAGFTKVIPNQDVCSGLPATTSYPQRLLEYGKVQNVDPALQFGLTVRPPDFTWSDINSSSIPEEPPLYFAWYKTDNSANQYTTQPFEFVGSTNVDVADVAFKPLTDLDINTRRKNYLNDLFDIVPKVAGKAKIYLSFLPSSIGILNAMGGISATDASTASVNLQRKIYELDIVVTGGEASGDSWSTLSHGCVSYERTTDSTQYSSDLVVWHIAKANGDPFESFEKCDTNTAFNEVRTNELVDFNKPEFKVSHWIAGTFNTSSVSYSGYLSDVSDMDAAIQAVKASFFDRTILHRVRLFDAEAGDVRSAAFLANNALAKGVYGAEAAASVITAGSSDTLDLKGQELIELGFSHSLLSATKSFYVPTGTIKINQSLMPDHEYALYFSMLPGYCWPYFSNGINNSAWNSDAILKKDVIFRFRTKPQATSLQLDSEQSYISTIQPGKDPETVTVTASLLAGDKPASGTVKWTMNRSDVADMVVSEDGLSATFTAKASSESSVMVTASAYDAEGKAISGATASCIVTAAYPFDKIAFQDDTYFLAAVDGRMISFGMQASRPTYTVNGQVVTFSHIGKWPQSVRWTSSDESVATVDSYGDVRPVGNGDATITVTAVAPYDGKNYASASCVVKVREMANSITLDKTSAILPAPTSAGAASVQLAATLLTASGQPVSSDIDHVNWTSSDTSVVTVDENGKVTAVGQGTAAITASSDTDKSVSLNGVKATCTVQVFPFASSVTLDKTSLTLDAPGFLGTGTSATLTPTIVFPTGQSNYMNKVKISSWESSDESVATVANGVVTAVAPGNATIKAVANYPDDGSVYGECAVAVVTPEPSLEFDISSLEIAVGATGTLAASWVNGTEELEAAGLEWSSDNTSVVTVDSTGGIEAVGEGSATITVSSVADPTIMATIGVLVRVVPAKLEISEAALALETKKKVSETTTAELTAQLLDASGNPLNVGSLVWESSDPAVASVVGEGDEAVVTAVGGGTANVTVKFQAPTGTQMEWPQLSATCQVTVTDLTPAIIQMSHASLVMEAPEDGSYAMQPLAVSVTNKAGVPLDDDVALESTDPSVVSVDPDGTLTALSAGSATIKATCFDAQPALCAVAVHVFPTEISMVAATDEQNDVVDAINSGKPYELQVEDGFPLPALQVLPEGAGYSRIEWSTSHPAVLEVPAAGGHAIAKAVNEDGVKVTATVVMMDVDKIVTNGKASTAPASRSLMAVLTGAEEAYATEGEWEAPSASFDVVVHEREAQPSDGDDGDANATGAGTSDGDDGNANATGAGTKVSAPGTSLAKTGDTSMSSALMFTAAAALAGAGAYVMHKMSERDKAQVKEGAKEVGDFIDEAITSVAHGIVKAKASFMENAGLADGSSASAVVHDGDVETDGDSERIDVDDN